MHAIQQRGGFWAGSITYDLTNVAPLSVAFFAFGFGRTVQPFGNGCDILLAPVLPFYLGPVITGPGAAGSGFGQATITLPAGYSGLNITTQGVVLENGNAATIVLSNGVVLVIP